MLGFAGKKNIQVVLTDQMLYRSRSSIELVNCAVCVRLVGLDLVVVGDSLILNMRWNQILNTFFAKHTEYFGKLTSSWVYLKPKGNFPTSFYMYLNPVYKEV